MIWFTIFIYKYLQPTVNMHFTFCRRFFRWRCKCFCAFPNLIVQLKGFCIRIKWGMLLTIATFLFRFYEPVWIKRYLNVCIKSQGVGCNHFFFISLRNVIPPFPKTKIQSACIQIKSIGWWCFQSSESCLFVDTRIYDQDLRDRTEWQQLKSKDIRIGAWIH